MPNPPVAPATTRAVEGMPDRFPSRSKASPSEPHPEHHRQVSLLAEDRFRLHETERSSADIDEQNTGEPWPVLCRHEGHRAVFLKTLDVIVKGPGPGRESAIRALQASTIRVRSIRDITPVTHNGCRAPKKRRV